MICPNIIKKNYKEKTFQMITVYWNHNTAILTLRKKKFDLNKMSLAMAFAEGLIEDERVIGCYIVKGNDNYLRAVKENEQTERLIENDRMYKH